MNPWLVPPREWPVTAWAFIAYLMWVYLLPSFIQFETRFGMWLLGWAGYYAYHPMHDGMSMTEIRKSEAA